MIPLTTEAPRARYTHRLVVLEAPEVVEQLERLAVESGRSLGAEVRAALRYWLAATEDPR